MYITSLPETNTVSYRIKEIVPSIEGIFWNADWTWG